MGSNLTKVTVELAELRLEPGLALSKPLDLCYFLCIDSQVHLYVQSSGSRPGLFCSPGGHLSMSADILFSHLERKVLLASSGWRPGILLNCHRTAPPSQHRAPVPNVSSAGAEKPGLQAPSDTCMFSCVKWRH